MGADFVEIRAELPADAEDGLAEALNQRSVLGAQIAPGDGGSIAVAVWVPAERPAVVGEIEDELAGLGGGAVERRSHAEADWAAMWRDALQAFPVGGRWWIEPHPDRPSPVPDGRLRLVVEPRAAFGSGTHESTRLVLEQLEVSTREGCSVLDLGTGSGVLAVAAFRLGAAAVVAVDNDPLAAWEARHTARAQPWRCRPMIVAGTLDCLGPTVFDLVLCNMLVSEFEPLLPAIVQRLDASGSLLLSGLLEDERRRVESRLESHGLRVDRVRTAGEWTSLRALGTAS